MDLLEKLKQKRAQIEDLKAKIDDIKVEIIRVEGQIACIKELIEEDGGEEVEELRAATEEDEERVEPEDEMGFPCEEEHVESEEELFPEDYEAPFDVEDCPVVDSEEAQTEAPEPEQLNLYNNIKFREEN